MPGIFLNDCQCNNEIATVDEMVVNEMVVTEMVFDELVFNLMVFDEMDADGITVGKMAVE